MPKGTPTIQPAKTVEYETPRDLFDKLWDEVGGFDLDPCCRPGQYTAIRTWEDGGAIMVPTETDKELWGDGDNRVLVDGLTRPWYGKVYMNPLYGPALRQWVPKAVHEVKCGNAELVMALLPAKTEVRWWQEYVLHHLILTPILRLPGGAIKDATTHSHPLVREVRFIKGRLKFGGADGGPARVGNVIVVWRK
jgi:hypothetical protein